MFHLNQSSWLESDHIKSLVAAIPLAACCFLLAFLCKKILSVDGNAAVIWFSDAVTIAFLYRYPLKSWPVLLIASYVGNSVAALISGITLVQSLLYSCAGLVEAVLAAALLICFCSDGNFFNGMWRWLRFTLFAALLPTIVGAGIGGWLVSQFNPVNFYDVFVSWYLADLFGIAVMLPLILMLNREILLRTCQFQQLAHLLSVSAITLAGIWLLLNYAHHPFIFVAIPLIWAASRLELAQALFLIFCSILLTLGVLTSEHFVLQDGLGLVENPLLLMSAYATVIPAYVMAVSSNIEGLRNRRIMEVESSFRAAMATSRIGMLLVSLDSRIIQANASFCRFIGYPEVELIGRKIFDITHVNDLQHSIKHRDTLFSGREQSLDMEKRYVRKNGEVVWGHISSSLARGARNEPLYAVVQVEDIDWRKRSEQQLSRAEERWKFSLMATAQGVYDWDLVTANVFYSDWLSSCFGIAQDVLKSREDWLRRVHRNDRENLLKIQRQHLRAEIENIECVYRVRTDAGEYRWISESSRIMEFSESGEPLRLIGLLRDITDNRMLAQSLAEEKERLQVTLTAIADAVIATDVQQNITFMNPVAEELTGWSLTEVRGLHVKTVFQISCGREGAQLNCPVADCLDGGIPVFSAEGTVLHSRDGTSYDVKCSAAPLKTDDGDLLGAVMAFQDISETRQLIQQLSYKASHDDLTHLPNRDAFKRELNQAVNSVQDSDEIHVLAYIDLDRFKVINDSAGHQAGDALLKQVGKFLRGQLRASDSVARLGGDEFGLLFRFCNKEQAQLRCEQLVRQITTLRFPWNSRVFDIGASVGLTEIHRNNNQMVDLLSQADVACYSAKHAGRSSVAVYEMDQSAAAEQHREILMASVIREALDEDRLLLYAQPISCAIDHQKISHYELLVRMIDRSGKLIMPGAFIPSAERYGLMVQIDHWVSSEFLLRQAQAVAASDLSFALNISAEALGDFAFQAHLLSALECSPVVPQKLGFEITETAMVNQMESASLFVESLREMGCKVALDDFGNGLSSFNYLKAFSIDFIKIDGSFVRHVESNFVDLMIVESINQVAHRLNARTIAEFVEDEPTAERLRTIGVDLVQGYHIGRPVPLSELLAGNSGVRLAAAQPEAGSLDEVGAV